MGRCIHPARRPIGASGRDAGTQVSTSVASDKTGSGVVAGAGGVVRHSAADRNRARRVGGGDGAPAIGNSIPSNSAIRLVMGDNRDDHENTLTSNDGGTET